MATTPKNLKFGNREKIIAIALGATLIITITHFLLYRPKSLELTEVNKDYASAYDKYMTDASKNLPASDIKALQTDVTDLYDLLTVSITSFQIGKEKEIVGGGPKFMSVVDDIKALEKNTAKPKITVLEDWTIADDIPGLDPARIPDYLDQLKQKKAIISMSNIDSTLKENFDSQYREVLQRIGFNQIDLGKLNGFIAWLKEARMYFYIKAHKGAYDIKDADLYSILNIPTYTPDFFRIGLFFLYRTKDLINLAIQSQVDTVSNVKILGRKEVRPFEKETPPTTPTRTTNPIGFLGQVGEGRFMHGRGGPPAPGRGEGIQGPAGLLGLTNRGGSTTTPTQKSKPASAISVPIEITVTGDNISIIKFLYVITHSPVLMDIREMSIASQEEGKLTATITVNCYRDVKTIDDFENEKIAKTTPQSKPKK